MGRPVASEYNKQLGIAFSKAVRNAPPLRRSARTELHERSTYCAGSRLCPFGARSGACVCQGAKLIYWWFNRTQSVRLQVTVPCEDSTRVVARSGQLSLFSALEECCPGCIRNLSTANGRRGLTMIEFNKSLEKEGFEKMRDRRADAATRQEDPTGGTHPVMLLSRIFRQLDC